MGKVSKETKKVSIGGQAVIEGVMMRGKTAMATAVRDGDGIIRLETKRIKPNRNLFLKLPIIRGIVSFFSSFFGGINTLMRSAEVFGESEPTKFETWVSKKFKIDVLKVIAGLALILGFVLAVALFIVLPQVLRRVLENLCGITFGKWAKNFIEGGIKLLVFVSYIVFCSLFKDIKRTFMYHGAEHKTISCYEKGLELTPENAKKCTRVHDRCGTTFIVFVMLISILVIACFESLVTFEINGILRAIIKLLFLPLVAGLSYELLKGLAKTKCWIFYPLKVPGLLLQRITTKEPDLDMLEVAITAFKKVMEMDNDQSIGEVKFATPEKRNLLVNRIKSELKENGIEEDAEAEWIVSITLGVKRSELKSEKLVSITDVQKIEEIVKERITGRPLWYCIGDTEFYGYKIKVDERVLIPRPETEILVENALKYINSQSSVLDLCTGSGAIAVAINKKTNANVVGTDISSDALDVAKENCKLNDAKIEFIQSDLFSCLGDRKFDVIVSNPPYIKSEDILSLQKEVKDYEPVLALDGGVDGLDFYRRIVKDIDKHLNSNGIVLMECGIDEAEQIQKMFGNKFTTSIIKDYENIDRIVVAVLNV